MFIHYYHSQNFLSKEYPYICAFYRPYDPKYSEMLAWLEKTYKTGDIENQMEYGEVRFRSESDAALFLMRWQ